MENAEEVLQCLEEFSKLRPKDIPRELEDYLCFVAKTGDPVYQWPLIKCLFREKLLNVITEFYEACPSVEIPPCPNVEPFNYDAMKTFILGELDSFGAAPFTVQRICELLTTPRKEYNRIDKFMRALEKNILVVSTREPGNRKTTENGESVVNGLESEHMPQEIVNSEINVEVEMDESSVWQKSNHEPYAVNTTTILETQQSIQDTFVSDSTKAVESTACTSSVESVITTRYIGYTPNISDLIIEQSNMSNNIVIPTSLAAETPEPLPEPQTMTVFSLNSTTSTRTEQVVETSKDEPVVHTYVKSIEQIAAVYVKADCSDNIYSLNAQPEQPESTLVQMETSEQKDPQVISEPITPPSVEESPEETSTPTVIELQVPESSENQTRQPESSTSFTIPTPSTSTTVASIITTTTVEAEPSEPSEPSESSEQSSEAEFQEQPMDTSSVESSQLENLDQHEPEPSDTCSTTTIIAITRQEAQEEVHHQSNEETISSSDEKPNSSMEVPVVTSEVTDVSTTPDEEEVTESNIDSEYTVSQTTEEPSEIAVSEIAVPEIAVPEIAVPEIAAPESTAPESPEISAPRASSPSSSTPVIDQSIVIGPEDMQVEDISPPEVNSPTEAQPSETIN